MDPFIEVKKELKRFQEKLPEGWIACLGVDDGMLIWTAVHRDDMPNPNKDVLQGSQTTVIDGITSRGRGQGLRLTTWPPKDKK